MRLLLAPLLASLLALAAPAWAQEDPEPTPPPESAPTETAPAQEEAEPVPVAAAEESASNDATVLDTIEVTSSKRAKSARDLPGSVGALRGEALEKIHAQGMADYMKLIPGVGLTDYGTGQQIAVIRGISSSTGSIGTHFTGLTTGVFLDDIPFNDLYAPLSIPDVYPFDLERVEVLKGPQGTLFGSSALAGAVRYIVQKPNLAVWQGKLSQTFTQTRFAEGPTSASAGALNVPIGSAAALRLVGVFKDDPGLYDSLANGTNTRHEIDADRYGQWTGRALGRWDLTDDLKISAMYFQQETERDDQLSANQPQSPERNDVPFAAPLQNDFGGANLSATWDLALAQVSYSGNLLDKHTYSKGAQEPSLPQQLGNQEAAEWYNLIIGDVKGYTHELRFISADGDSDWEWLGGIAFMNYTQEFFQFTPNPGDPNSGYYANPPEQPEDVAPADRTTSFLWATVDGDGTEKALFGEVTRRLGEHWEATVGARYFRTELISDAILTGAQIVALGEPGQTESNVHSVSQESGINPKFSLRYLHNENMQLYALVAKGFQFGGFQLNPPIANIEEASESRGYTFGPYKSSVLWNYEMGLRTEWLDRRLRLDLTGFYLDWTDLQLTIAVPINPVGIPAPPGSGIPENVTVGVIANVAAAHSEGIEASLEVVPFPGATITSSAAWISALTEVAFDADSEDGPVPAGTRLPGSPRFQWANVFSYSDALPYFSSWVGGIAFTHSHIGSSPNAIRKVLDVGGYDTLDARLDLALPGNNWIPEFSLGLNNLTDVRGVSAYGGDGDAVNAYYFVRPRTALLSVAWHY